MILNTFNNSIQSLTSRAQATQSSFTSRARAMKHSTLNARAFYIKIYSMIFYTLIFIRI